IQNSACEWRTRQRVVCICRWASGDNRYPSNVVVPVPFCFGERVNVSAHLRILSSQRFSLRLVKNSQWSKSQLVAQHGRCNAQSEDVAARLHVPLTVDQRESLLFYQQRELRQAFVAMQVVFAFDKRGNPVMLFGIVAEPLQ